MPRNNISSSAFTINFQSSELSLSSREEEESSFFSEKGGDLRFEILFVRAFAVGVQVDWGVGEDETGFLGFEGFFAEGVEEIGGGILGVLRGSLEGFGGGEAGRRVGAEFDWCLGLLVWFGGHLFGCFAVEWMCLGVVARVRWYSYIRYCAMKE